MAEAQSFFWGGKKAVTLQFLSPAKYLKYLAKLKMATESISKAKDDKLGQAHRQHFYLVKKICNLMFTPNPDSFLDQPLGWGLPYAYEPSVHMRRWAKMIENFLSTCTGHPAHGNRGYVRLWVVTIRQNVIKTILKFKEMKYLIHYTNIIV